jgi:hypothetical protein
VTKPEPSVEFTPLAISFDTLHRLVDSILTLTHTGYELVAEGMTIVHDTDGPMPDTFRTAFRAHNLAVAATVCALSEALAGPMQNRGQWDADKATLEAGIAEMREALARANEAATRTMQEAMGRKTELHA